MFTAVLWVGSAVMIIRSALRSRRHPEAVRAARRAFAFLFVLAGAAMNALFLASGEDYRTFADGSSMAFVRHTWHSLVVPHHHAWIGLLVVFELTVGLLALLGGRPTQVAYVLAIAFHVALLSFGWGFAVWSVPMVAALCVLLRAEQSDATPGVPATVG